MQEFKVRAEDDGKRTDMFVAEQFPQFARSALRGLFKEKLVSVNGKAEEPGDKLKSGDIVSIDASPLHAEPPKIKLPIIYEDDDVIVIDKPAGILTHSKGALNSEATVASFIKKRLIDEKLEGNRAGIVHRLDRDTSGVMITARNSAALSHLQKQFSQRKPKKTYLAVVEGVPEPPEAIIDAPLLRNPHRPQTFKVGSGGNSALTHYKLLKSFRRNGESYSLLDLKPTTGRTHQLRVHLAYIGHPVVGDRVYGKAGDGLMLHAKSLEVTLPGDKRRVFTSSTPGRIKDLVNL